MGISWRGNEGGGGLISIATIDRGRVVGAFTRFSRSVCMGLVFSGVEVSAELSTVSRLRNIIIILFLFIWNLSMTFKLNWKIPRSFLVTRRPCIFFFFDL